MDTVTRSNVQYFSSTNLKRPKGNYNQFLEVVLFQHYKYHNDITIINDNCKFVDISLKKAGV